MPDRDTLLYNSLLGLHLLEQTDTDGQIPEVVLIPGFDQFLLGYEDRDRFLDKKYAREVTNVAGIISPVILIRKRLRARWKFDGDRVIVTPFEKLYKKDEAAIRRAFKKAFGKRIQKTEFDECTSNTAKE